MPVQARQIRDSYGRRYMLAFAMVAMVATAAFIAGLELSRLEQSRGRILSAAAGQAAATQRAAFLANAYANAEPSLARNNIGGDLSRTVLEMRSAHDFLTQRRNTTASERGQLAAVQDIYFSGAAPLDDDVSAFLDDIDALLGSPDSASPAILARVNAAAAGSLARRQARVVSALEDRAANAVTRLARVQALCWIAILLVLFLVGIFLLRPLGRRIEEIVRKFEETEIATQRAAEAALKTASANANFLRIMSHEIRTPLNAVTGIAHLLHTQKLPETAAEQIKHLSAASEHLFSLTENVLDFSKINAGHITLAAAPFNLRDELINCADIIEPLAKEKGLSLSVEITELAAARFDGDVSRIRQIVLNLLSNALKFTDHGSVALKCQTVRQETGVTTFSLTVADTGVGVSANQRAKIFRAFEQVGDFETRRHGGAGLGLAIVSGLIKAMGGSIFLDSKPGAGSTFTVTLPLPKSQNPGERDLARANASAHPRRVLVVEDNIPNQLIAKAFLNAADFDVVVANNGQEAVEAVVKEKFDLVLMDINMPVMNGLEATRLLRKNPNYKTTPILAYTAHAIEEDRSDLLAAGLNDILNKPVTEKNLVDRVKQWIANDDPTRKSDAA